MPKQAQKKKKSNGKQKKIVKKNKAKKKKIQEKEIQKNKRRYLKIRKLYYEGDPNASTVHNAKTKKAEYMMKKRMDKAREQGKGWNYPQRKPKSCPVITDEVLAKALEFYENEDRNDYSRRILWGKALAKKLGWDYYRAKDKRENSTLGALINKCDRILGVDSRNSARGNHYKVKF